MAPALAFSGPEAVGGWGLARVQSPATVSSVSSLVPFPLSSGLHSLGKEGRVRGYRTERSPRTKLPFWIFSTHSIPQCTGLAPKADTPTL